MNKLEELRKDLESKLRAVEVAKTNYRVACVAYDESMTSYEIACDAFRDAEDAAAIKGEGTKI